MPTTCALLFENNPQNVFYSGQLMIGNIHLNLTREKKIRGIFLKIKGKSQTRWSEGSGDDGKNYGTTEEYLNTKTYLVGDYNGKNQFKFILAITITYKANDSKSMSQKDVNLNKSVE